MAGGLTSASAPELVPAEFRLERAAILHPRMAALIVQANRLNHATRKTVLPFHVRIVEANTCLVANGITYRIILLMMSLITQITTNILTNASTCLITHSHISLTRLLTRAHPDASSGRYPMVRLQRLLPNLRRRNSVQDVQRERRC